MRIAAVASAATFLIELTELWRRFSRRPKHAQDASPISRLPVELLGSIFAECDNDNDGRLTLCDITSVCFLWRAVALSMPTLWSTIDIRDPLPWHVPMVKLWAQRSGDVTLKIHIGKSVEWEEHKNLVLLALLPHLHRCQPLHVNKGLPSLLPEAASFIMMDESNDQQSDTIHSYTIQWSGTFAGKFTGHQPFGHISHIDDFAGNVRDCLELLSYVPSVQSIRRFSVMLGPTPPTSSCSIFLPNLEAFFIIELRGHSTDEQSNLSSILNALTVPSLQGLEMHCRSEIPPLTTALSGLLDRSFCSLKSLIITHEKDMQQTGSCSPTDVDDSLADLVRSPRLAELTKLVLWITGRIYRDNSATLEKTLKALSHVEFLDSGPRYQCPDVEHLEIKLQDPSALDTVRRMFASRITYDPSRFTTFRFSTANGIWNQANRWYSKSEWTGETT
ncbi:hypothetical protein C8J56DRAFT_392847 [Mycena floridula]|nr:hypothetical protein C8J56DRAFT_392847 [Mycena floridula]